MEHSAAISPSPNSSSFAGLLTSLTAPVKEETDRVAAWSDDGLGDDVVTLSYDRALRNHARYRAADGGDVRLPSGADETRDGTARMALAVKNGAGSARQAHMAPRAAPGRDLRTSSVTIRLSDAERLRVRERAAEAGLTVSAYLRSCVLEADALRAQVKEALAEMREAGNKGTRDHGNKKTKKQASEAAGEQVSKETSPSWVQRLLRRRS